MDLKCYALNAYDCVLPKRGTGHVGEILRGFLLSELMLIFRAEDGNSILELTVSLKGSNVNFQR